MPRTRLTYPLDLTQGEARTACIYTGLVTREQIGVAAYDFKLTLAETGDEIINPRGWYHCECYDEITTGGSIFYDLTCDLSESISYVYVLYTPRSNNDSPDRDNTRIIGLASGVPNTCFKCLGGGENCDEDCRQGECEIYPGETIVSVGHGCPPFHWMTLQSWFSLYPFYDADFILETTEERSNSLIVDVHRYTAGPIYINTMTADTWGRITGCRFKIKCPNGMFITGDSYIPRGDTNWFYSGDHKIYKWILDPWPLQGGFYFDSVYHSTTAPNSSTVAVHAPADWGRTLCGDPCPPDISQQLEMHCLIESGEGGDEFVPSKYVELPLTTDGCDESYGHIVYTTSHMECNEVQSFSSSDGLKYNWKVYYDATDVTTWHYSVALINLSTPSCNSSACRDISDGCQGSIQISMMCGGDIADEVNVTINCIDDDELIAFWTVLPDVDCGRTPPSACDQNWQFSAFNCIGEDLGTDWDTGSCTLPCDDGYYPNCRTRNNSGGRCYGNTDTKDKRRDCVYGSQCGTNCWCYPGNTAIFAYIADGCCPEDLIGAYA